MTVNQVPSMNTRGRGSRSRIPSLWAATEPSTTAGPRIVASSRKRPARKEPPNSSSTSVRAASTPMPPVSSSLTRSLRRTVASTRVVCVTDSTGPMRAAITRASSGTSDPVPSTPPPGVTRSKLVPSRSRVAIRSARPDAEMPITATMAAIPMAMPIAVSTARAGRAASPRMPSPSKSLGRSRLLIRWCPRRPARPAVRRFGETAPPAHARG